MEMLLSSVDQDVVIAYNVSLDRYRDLLAQGLSVMVYYRGFGYRYFGLLSRRGAADDACLGCLLTVLDDHDSDHVHRLRAIMDAPEVGGLDPGIDPGEMAELGALLPKMVNGLYIQNLQDGSTTQYLVMPHFKCDHGGRGGTSRGERGLDLDLDLGLDLGQDLDVNRVFPQAMRFKAVEAIFKSTYEVDRLVNPHTGIGKRIFRDASSAVIPMYCIQAQLSNREYYAYGRTVDIKSAKYSSALELIERYASMVPHRHTQEALTLNGSFETLSQAYPLVSPRDLNCHGDLQREEPGFNMATYRDTDVYRWVACRDYFNNAPVYLPEQVVYFDNQVLAYEPRFIYETSNGCAVGGTIEEAILYSLFEVVERDSFLVFWYNGLTPKRLHLNDLNQEDIRQMVDFIEDQGYEIFVFDITLETRIPAIWTLVVDRREGVEDGFSLKSYTAAGAHLNPEKALEAALVEIITSLSVYNQLILEPDKQALLEKLRGNPSAVREMEDHIYYHALEDHHHFLDFATSCKGAQAFKSAFPEWYGGHGNHGDHGAGDLTLAKVMDRFKPFHPKIYIANLENSLLRGMDISCVKTIIPSMLTMTFGHQNRRLNMDRILRGPVDAGLTSAPIDPSQINLCPHPFP